MKKIILFVLLSILVSSCDQKIEVFKCKTNDDIFKGYYNIIVIKKDVDTSTFTCLDGGYAKDKKNVYSFPDYYVEKADPQTFEVIELMYGKDKSNVYYISNKIKEADPQTFETMDFPYSRDKKNVYNGKSKIKEADLNTFISYYGNQTLEGIVYNAEDKNNYYKDGEIVKKK